MICCAVGQSFIIRHVTTHSKLVTRLPREKDDSGDTQPRLKRTTMDTHHPNAIVGTALLALPASAILVSFRGLFPHRSDDNCAAIVHSTDDVPPPPRPLCFPTVAAPSLVPLLIFLMVRYVSLRLYLRN